MGLSKAEEAAAKIRDARAKAKAKMDSYANNAATAAAVPEGAIYAVGLRRLAERYPRVDDYATEITLLIGGLEGLGFVMMKDGAARSFLGASMAGKVTLGAWLATDPKRIAADKAKADKASEGFTQGATQGAEIGITPGVLFTLIKALKAGKLSSKGIEGMLNCDAETAGKVYAQVQRAVEEG